MIVPPITEELKAEALRSANGYVYVLDENYSKAQGVHPTAILGAWKVNEYGIIERIFIPNPNYKNRVN